LSKVLSFVLLWVHHRSCRWEIGTSSPHRLNQVSSQLMQEGRKNALIPVVTILGLQFGNMPSGAVAIEVIFGRRGIDSYLARTSFRAYSGSGLVNECLARRQPPPRGASVARMPIGRRGTAGACRCQRRR